MCVCVFLYRSPRGPHVNPLIVRARYYRTTIIIHTPSRTCNLRSPTFALLSRHPRSARRPLHSVRRAAAMAALRARGHGGLDEEAHQGLLHHGHHAVGGDRLRADRLPGGRLYDDRISSVPEL